MLKIMRWLWWKVRGVNNQAIPAAAISLPAFTLHNGCRFLYQKRVMDMIRDVDGDIVECGVGAGQTLLYWAILSYDEGRNRRIWGFDSFEGFPEPTVEDTSPRNPKKGEWTVGSVPSVVNLLRESGLDAEWIRSRVTLVKGFFEDSLPKYTGSQIALLHIDADLYHSYKTSLELLYPKVAGGG